MPVKYIPFFPEPIEGQALLDNFKRTLKYTGNLEVENSLKRGMPYYELEEIEKVGKNKDNNLLIHGECISACAYLKEQGIKVDLVYIDPPFASGADYAKKVYIRRNPLIAETIKKAEEELETDADFREFEETMYGDVWDKEKYLNWMYENLMAIKSVMSENASIYVHLDYHICHYVKILMDEIFGEDNFMNEIIWHYENKFTFSFINNFNANTENILLYAMNKGTQTFHHIVIPTKNTRKQNRITWDADAKKMVTQKDENGNVIYYESSEKIATNMWNIPRLNSQAKDRKDYEYATQKPEALLERVINASSDKGMVVADFFSGSGTTVKVANDLGRKFIGCDVGINSIQTTRDRLVANKAQFSILDIKDGVSLYRNPIQTMKKIKSFIPGLKDESSLSSFWSGSISESKKGMTPVYIPNLIDSSSKLLDVVTINKILHEEIPDLPSSVKKVVVYYVDISNREEIEKFISDDDSTTVEIELRDLKTILDNVVVEDYVEYEFIDGDSLLEQYKIQINKFISDRVVQKIDAYNQKGIFNSDKKKFNPIQISDEGLETIELISLDCKSSDDKVWNSDSEIKIDKYGYVMKNGQKTNDFWDGTISCENKPLRMKIRNICGDETTIIL